MIPFHEIFYPKASPELPIYLRDDCRVFWLEDYFFYERFNENNYLLFVPSVRTVIAGDDLEVEIVQENFVDFLIPLGIRLFKFDAQQVFRSFYKNAGLLVSLKTRLPLFRCTHRGCLSITQM